MTDAAAQARKQLLRQALDRIDELERRLAVAQRGQLAPIALVSAACRLPGGAEDPEALWANLTAGRSAVREVPIDRWDVRAHYDPDPAAPGKTYARHGGFLDAIDGFDPLVFGISPRDAACMDPQHRLLCEVTWEALERAGLPPADQRGTRTGVFVGLTVADYARLIDQHGGDHVDAYPLTGSLLNFAAGRVAHVLGLMGPAMAIDTACSSSLVAVHLACQSLRAGECRAAIAGGVNLMLTPQLFVLMSKARLLSPTGRTRAFDAAADGMVRAEGCGVVVLKRLDDALEDGDPVLAVIRGSAVNQDGPSSGLTAPNRHAQEQVIARALEVAGIHPHEVGYVEAHGTGTPLGDPIEIRALASVLCRGRPADRPLRVGSIKTNLGHAESAAGFAGLLKLALVLAHGEIPPHLGLTDPSPHIDWPALCLEVPTRRTPWGDGPRIGGVSSFGASGTNAHVVLTTAPPTAVREPARDRVTLLPLSARSPAALTAMARAWSRQLGAPGVRVGDLGYTAGVRRSHLEHRLTVVGRTADTLRSRLDRFVRGEDPDDLPSDDALRVGRALAGREPDVVFVFPGQGSQWPGMARALLAEEPVFRDAVAACDAELRRQAGWSVRDVLSSDDPAALEAIDVVQPALFTVSVALAALWRSWGVEPGAVVGHSMGEVAAAHVAGALSLEHAMQIIGRRSRLLRRVSGLGGMALIELGLREAEVALDGRRDRLSVAVSNGPRSTVVAGDAVALDELIAELSARDVFCRRIKVDVASHSPQVDPLLDELRGVLAGVRAQDAAVPIASTVTGALTTGGEFDGEYWAQNLRRPVLFGSAVRRLLERDACVFVEMSPHPILTPAIDEVLRDAGVDGVALPSLRRDVDARSVLLGSLAELYVRGVPVDLRPIYPADARLAAAPTYPWQRTRHWLADGAPRAAPVPVVGGARVHPLLGAPLSLSAHASARYWQQSVSVDDMSYLADHRVRGEAMLPASATIEMALAATDARTLTDIELERPILLDRARTLQLALTDDGRYQVASLDGETWTRCASGRGGEADPSSTSEVHRGERPAAVRARLTASTDDLYARLGARGLAYGARFRGVVALWVGRGEALARLEAPADVAADPFPYVVHPALLDSYLHPITATLPEDGVTYVPARIDRLVVHATPGRVAWAHARRRGPRRFDVTVVEDDGRPSIEVTGLEVVRLRSIAAARDRRVVTLEWPARPIVRSTPSTGRVLVLADADDPLAAAVVAHAGACVRVIAGDCYARLSDDRYQVDPDDPAAYRVLLGDAFGDGRHCAGVVHCWSRTASALALAQSMIEADWRVPPRLLLVTRGAQAVDPSPRGAIAVEQATLWGFGRTLQLEHPELRCACIDLPPAGDPSAEAEAEAAAILAELSATDGEGQVARRDGVRRVARLAPVPLEPGTLTVRADATYLITGGLGGLGLALARRLCERGARHLAVVGRNPPTEAAGIEMAALGALGARVQVIAADVTDRAAVERAFECLHDRPPLAGIIHAAGVLDDATILELSAARLARVLAPKLDGAWHLHELSRDLELDFFVLYAAAAGLLGSPGQASYAAANASLDALAHERRRLGLPALAIDWGPFAEVGLAAARDDRGARLARRGFASLTPAEGLDLLERMLGSSAGPQLGVIDLDVTKWLEFHPGVAGVPFWSELARSTSASVRRDAGRMRQRLTRAPANERRGVLERLLADELRRVLRLSPEQLDRHTAFSGLGVDSLRSLEVRNRLEVGLGLRLKATLLYTYPDLASLAEYLHGALALEDGSTTTRVPAESPGPTVSGAAQGREPIAIIGVACRFPGGADTPEALWRILDDGVDAVGEVPRDRVRPPAGPSVAARAARWGAFLEGIDRFDPQFFGISPREAVRMDPQQRLLLEVAWEALERAGLAVERLHGSRTGVFVGLSTNDYAEISAAADPSEQDVYDMTGNTHCFPSGRLSYVLGVHGPSLTVDTACSSSLVAVHLASQSLRVGDSDLALAGGVNVILSPLMTVRLAKAGGLSVDGRCKTFDARANGFVRGEGCGVLVLKRLADARRDGDPVLALIRGSAVNQDGRSAGLTAPNGRSQEDMLRRALHDAGVGPDEIDYIETHGTGTALGDPIELDALAAVLGTTRADGAPCVLGAVKTNLGHLEAAAGAAGLIKAVLALQHERIPANLHFQTLNPRVTLDGTPFVIPTTPRPWSRGGRTRRAGVSSFGLSGTNAHVVLEEAPAGDPPAAAAASPARGTGPALYLLPVSARCPAALAARARDIAACCADHRMAIDDLAYTLSLRASHHPHRFAPVGRSRAELAAALAEFGRGGESAIQGVAPADGRARLVFVFPGQGSQWIGMAQGLLDRPAFRSALDACDAAIARESGASVVATLALSGDEAAAALARVDLVQPILFALQTALAAEWRAMGVIPDAVVGHSMGEVAAACVAGALSIDDGARVVCRRSRLLSRVRGRGAMALVELAMADAQRALLELGREDVLSVAVSNGPRSTVISGDPAALDELLARLDADGVFTRRVKVDVASHSPQMDPLREDLLAALAELAPGATTIPMHSTVTGEVVAGPELDASYWADNLRRPVRFGEATRRLAESDHAVFLEIGPHPILVPSIEQTLRDCEIVGAAIGSVRRADTPAEEARSVHEALGALWANGCSVDFGALYPSRGQVVALPAYPWQRERYWLEVTPSASARTADPLDACVHQVAWRYAAAHPQVRPRAGAWLLLGDGSGLGTALHDLLSRRGDACVHVPQPIADVRELLDRRFDPDEGCAGIVMLSALDAGPPSHGALVATQAVITVVQALVQHGWRDPPPVWVVTRGAQAMGQGPVAPAHATLWGLGRTLALELPELSVARVDLDPAVSSVGDDAVRLLTELDTPDGEDQIVLRGGDRRVARVVRARLDDRRDPGAGPRPGAATAGFTAAPDATYLVTGGLGGLGLEVARWLVERGARHLALAGRREPSPAAAAVVEQLVSAGARVSCVRADVSRREGVEALLGGIAGAMPPLRGIVHAAAVLDDHTLLELRPEHVARVFGPKVAGAWYLHELTAGVPLDLFVMYSSSASLLGSPGQANYAAASAFLDALAEHRHACGLPGTSIQWGPFAEVGLAAAAQVRGRRLAQRGVSSLTAADGSRALDRVLAADEPCVGIVRFDVRQWIEFYPAAATDPFYAELRPTDGRAVAPDPTRGEAIRAAPPGSRARLVEQLVREEVARVLRLEASRIDARASFVSLGMDSLTGLELRNRFEAALGLRLSATLLYTYPTVRELVAGLLERLTPVPTSPAPDAAVESIRELSEQDAEAALLAELADLEEHA